MASTSSTVTHWQTLFVGDETKTMLSTPSRSINTVSDAEVEMNAACIPGITNSSLTNYLIDTCETALILSQSSTSSGYVRI